MRYSGTRRSFLRAAALGGLFYSTPGLFALTLVTTPAQTVGPYYPDRMPLKQDNDLLILNDSITPAIGEVSWISGRVLGRNGSPLRNALVEIWQADRNGAYIHSRSPIVNRDANFQGYGKLVTGSTGEYLFRTVKADPVSARPTILPVNGAGYQAGVTAGAWLSIFGDNLSATSRMWNPSTEMVGGKLPTSLDGVSVQMNGQPAAVYYVSRNQINVQAPSDDSTGPVRVTVTNANGVSDPVTLELQTYNPGFFLFPRNYVAAVRPDGGFIGPAGLFESVQTTPARPGESISLLYRLRPNQPPSSCRGGVPGCGSFDHSSERAYRNHGRPSRIRRPVQRGTLPVECRGACAAGRRSRRRGEGGGRPTQSLARLRVVR